MKKTIPLFLISLLCVMSAFAQTFEQIVETWPSTTYQTTATKLKVQHLNDDLEVVKEEYFDPNGLKVASYNIDPVTKKFHGDFFDGTNKGSYNQGILTANNFRLILEKPTSEVVFNVKNGIIQGKLIKTVAWRGDSKIEYRMGRQPYRIDNYIRYEQYINTEYNKYMRENNQKAPYFSEKKFILNYDDEGLLHGTHYIDRFHTMYFEHGECKGILTYDGQTGYNEFDDNNNFLGAKGYAIDSVFRDQKIWKRNFQLIKNCGFIEAYTLPNLYNVNEIRLLSLAAMDFEGINTQKIFIGQDVFKGHNFPNLKLFNSDKSVIANHIETFWWATTDIDFLFEYRTATKDKHGFFVSYESPTLSTFNPQTRWRTDNIIYNYHVDTVEHIELIFALQFLHCALISYGKEYFDGINFHQSINHPKNDLIPACQGYSDSYRFDRSVSTKSWLDRELLNQSEKFDDFFIDKYKKTGYFVLDEFYTKINQKPLASEIGVNFYFIKKDLRKTTDREDEENSLGFYDFDDIIDMKAIRAKKREIEEKFEKEQNEIKSKINSTVSSINIELKNEQWESLLPLSKSLDSLIKISNKNNYQITFSDPREEFLKGKDMDFISYLKNQIKLKKIESDYTSLKIGLEELAEKYKFEFTTNIKVSDNTTDLFERLSIKELSIDAYLKNLEKRMLRLNKVIDDYFSPVDKISFSAQFINKEGDNGSLYYMLTVAIDKPKKDFIKDKKSLQQEWKSNSPNLILQFSTNDPNKIVFRFGSLVYAFDYHKIP